MTASAIPSKNLIRHTTFQREPQEIKHLSNIRTIFPGAS
ncbi:hypothetical protein RO3G_00254 [Rhizopus delemar RA 99-880]|uniref:Uncharacterized protein n=1 Tax=Rhizopus delemar (strain RA 99-880 / ATCC MYA-4621 / FGSC 9543 / NRRL 43880) TaxID=246409 RepID=I1BH70_RHIO9|nr:hypothetical protein RO3G_00254 [Rhizopus delemar RA 99-880]|eukprot:EIE75550.1 hypothetical protein RO3G_00254 [Rhizopus delemar RA 99-880]